MYNGNIQILGIDEILKNNAQLMERAKKETITILDKAALDTESRAKRICPVDTGRLRASIHVDDPQPFLREVGSTDVEYAIYVEMGTYRSRAQPYMRPAFEAVYPGYQRAIEALARRISGR